MTNVTTDESTATMAAEPKRTPRRHIKGHVEGLGMFDITLDEHGQYHLKQLANLGLLDPAKSELERFFADALHAATHLVCNMGGGAQLMHDLEERLNGLLDTESDEVHGEEGPLAEGVVRYIAPGLYAVELSDLDALLGGATEFDPDAFDPSEVEKE